jgi:uncharacterized protein (DUF1501 family)
MSGGSGKSFDRRALLRLLASSGAALCGGIPPWLAVANPEAQAAGATPKRFLQVFLNGGWDSLLAIDPVPPGSSKASSGNFEPVYHNAGAAGFLGAPQSVAGKSQLLVGPGLEAARTAFAQLPTAFVNGLYLEVTAHELAANYVYSGVLSLSRSREYPAIIATMAAATGGFPSHLLLGGGIPLGATAAKSPPLQAFETDALVKMLAGPYSTTDYSAPSLAAAQELLATLDAGFAAAQSKAAKASLGAWESGTAGLSDLYARRLDRKIMPTDAQLMAFGAAGETASLGARLAVGALALKSGLTRFVSVNADGFDTHQDHASRQLPLQQQAAVALRALCDFLATTADPDSPSKKLAETTTVLVTSEFTRTPTFNAAGGTDHWQTGSAIVMGRGVVDGAVVGSTSDDGSANDYGDGKLLPDHLAASLLRSLGFAKEAAAVSEVHLDALIA